MSGGTHVAQRENVRVLARRIHAQHRTRLLHDGQHTRCLERARFALALRAINNRLRATANLLDDFARNNVVAVAPDLNALAHLVLGSRCA